MLKVENVSVTGWEAAIRGMRNPKNSWDKSDSEFCQYIDDNYDDYGPFIRTVNTIGDNDLSLMKTLANAGNDHGKFLRFITVTVDVTAPLYWWKEADQYKVGTVTDSCSTMHKIHAKEFTMGDFSVEHLDRSSRKVMSSLIYVLNDNREHFNGTAKIEGIHEDDKKDYWWQMIQLLPTSYNQKRTWLLNYQVLRNIYHARKNHKLDEWHTLCDWIETLPYAKELIVGDK